MSSRVMSSRGFSLVLLCLTWCGASVWGDEVREWTDRTGKFKTEAEFVGLTDGNVTLKKPGTDKTVSLPLERLSAADQKYVRERLAEQAAAEDAKQLEAKEREAREARAEAARQAQANQAQRDPSPAAPSLVPRPPNNVINSVRGAVFRVQTLNNMRQIGLALFNYESQRQSFPPAAILTREGKPGLSWRVAILPMLDENNLYRQFKLDEPWDSPHNKKLVSQMPSIYQSPGADLDDGFTNYLAVLGPNTVLATGKKGTRLRDIRDGTSNTIMVVEADDTYATPWTKPEEYVWDQEKPMYGLGGIWTGQFMALLADGSTRLMPLPDSADQLNALFSRDGGEAIFPGR